MSNGGLRVIGRRHSFAKVRRPTKSAVEAMRALLKPLKEKSSELSHTERMLFNTRNGVMSISLE